MEFLKNNIMKLTIEISLIMYLFYIMNDIVFYINLVKVQIIWVLKKREFHSFLDEMGVSKMQSYITSTLN